MSGLEVSVFRALVRLLSSRNVSQNTPPDERYCLFDKAAHVICDKVYFMVL